MRVALFTETFLPKVDGIVTVLILLMDHLIQRGVEFVVVAPKIGEDVNDYRGKKVIGVPGVTLPFYPELKFGPPTLRTYREVKDFQPDIAHFIHPTLVGTGGLMMAKRLNVPTLASFHLDLAGFLNIMGYGFLEPLVWWYTRTNFNAADYTLAPSRLVQREMLEHGTDPVRLLIVVHGPGDAVHGLVEVPRIRIAHRHVTLGVVALAGSRHLGDDDPWQLLADLGLQLVQCHLADGRIHGGQTLLHLRDRQRRVVADAPCLGPLRQQQHRRTRAGFRERPPCGGPRPIERRAEAGHERGALPGQRPRSPAGHQQP